MTPFPQSRTHLAASYAVLAPDSRMADELPGWRVGHATVLVSPRLGRGATPEHSLLWAELHDGDRVLAPGHGVERFVYLLDGALEVLAEGTRRGLERGGYALLPADQPHELRALGPCRLLSFERRYRPLPGADAPPVVVGRADAVEPRPFRDAAGVGVRPLLPASPEFDLSMTVLSYAPGATLPLVECHEPEHSLVMLAGGGLLHVDGDWHPLAEGDAVWLAPYCPHAFAGLGQTDASYLLYKGGRRGPWPAHDRP